MTKRLIPCFLSVCLLSFLLLPARAQERPVFSWSNVAIGGGGFVSAIIADPLESGLFYARTDVGGAYRWDNAESKWVSMMDWVDASERGLLGVEAIATDPKTAGKVYMVAGTSYWNDGRSAFLRSSDRGATWEVIYTWDPDGGKGPAVSSFGAHGNGMGRGNGEALAVDPNDPSVMFYGSKNKGLFKSTNNGTTWTKVSAFTAAAGSDTTWNGSGFSFVTFAPGSSSILYAGFLRSDNNVFRSVNGGAAWSVIPNRPKPAAGSYVPPLMPQRIAVTPNNSAVYITFGDGAGPHTMRWDEGWGGISDWFNRGAVFKYEPSSGAWTDVSPENFINPGDCGNCNLADTYVACYGGITINPKNPLELVVSTLGYRGPQFWKDPAAANKWYDQWGSNIYYSNDGGVSWYPSFKYYWMDGGLYPPVEQMDENGIGWMFNSSIHWSGSVAFDPFNPKRVWVTSGNGVFRTDDITDFTYEPPQNDWEEPTLIQRTKWKVWSHGIEETVPYEVISIPGGPLVSIILDYDGFRHAGTDNTGFNHDDIKNYPSSRHLTNVGGSNVTVGNTRTLAWAPKSGKLVKVSDSRLHEGQHNNIPFWPVQFSSDMGKSWSVTTYQSFPGANLDGAEGVSISTDGDVVLWTPSSEWDGANNVAVERPVQRLANNSAWTAVSGIDGAYTVGDPENANVFYAYNRRSGKFFKSVDKGVTFTQASEPGASGFQKFRAVLGREGEIWLPQSEGGLKRSKDGGATWTNIASVGYCEAVGFGKAAEGKDFPSVFIFGTVGAVTGVFMSVDEGESWWRANDDAHEYGGLANGEFVVGDMNVYGRVYMSTAGRGIVYGEITGTTTAVKGGKALPKMKAGAVQVRGTSIRIKADANVTHHVRVFDLKGRQLYRTMVSGPAAISMNRVLPKGQYIVSVQRDGADVFRNKMRVVR
ncbi:MAG: glycoside hydrolase [Chitinispirillia bacterium]|nr:glycoside hydrolase [Chitinispirillia bacterium]MCL2242656.1 glycoside hydrolase [Chitinispirillia bacterium]